MTRKLINPWLTATFFVLIILPTIAIADSEPSEDTLREAYLLRHSVPPMDALKSLDSLLESYPDSDELWEIKAELHMLNMAEVNLLRKRGQIRQSISAYERAVELNPQSFRAQGLLHTLYDVLPGMLGGDEQKAQEKTQELKALGNGLYAFALAIQAATQEQPEQQVEYLRQAVADAPNIVEYQIALVRSLIELEEWGAAKEALDLAVAEHSEYQPLVYQYARFYILQSQVPSDLKQTLSDLLAQQEQAPARFLAESVYLLRGRAHQLNGDVENARVDYEYVRRRAPRLIDEMDFTGYVDEVIEP